MHDIFAPASLSNGEKQCDLTARKIVNHVSMTRWTTFILAITFIYLSLYVTAIRFDWERDNKKMTDHFYQILYMFILSTFVYLFANIENTFSYWYLIGLFLGSYGIAFMGTLPGFQFSTGSLTKLRGIPLFTVLGFAAAVAYVFFLTFKHYKKCGMVNMYLIFLLVPVALLVLGYLLKSYDGESVDVHLHHWQWALLFVFFARFPGIPWQSLVSGAFLGIVIDGISRYGPDPLFIPAEP